MTVSEFLKSASDEQIARFLCAMTEINHDCYSCPAASDCYAGHNGFKTFLKKDARKCLEVHTSSMVDWL